MSPMSITRPAINNFRRPGSVEPGLFEETNFMSSVHAIRTASLYFFCLTGELSLQYAPYVLAHAYCQCRVVVTALLSCCATQIVFSPWHRFLWRCMSATCGFFVTKNGAPLAK